VSARQASLVHFQGRADDPFAGPFVSVVSVDVVFTRSPVTRALFPSTVHAYDVHDLGVLCGGQVIPVQFASSSSAGVPINHGRLEDEPVPGTRIVGGSSTRSACAGRSATRLAARAAWTP
jgi:hypothetical protein